MELVLKLLYYPALGLTGLINVVACCLVMYDAKSNTHARLFALACIVAVMAILYKAYVLGEQQHKWGMGLGVILLAWLAWILIVVIGFFTYKGPINWQ
jgi:FtsH-binding integral membrane protein